MTLHKITKTLVLGFTAVFLTSCELDDDLLGNDIRDEFTGKWLVNENSTFLGDRNYEVDIESDTTRNARIEIYNLYKIGASNFIYAEVSAIEANTITIPGQLTGGQDYVEGSGRLTGNSIQLEYYVDDGNGNDTVTATFSR